MKRSNQLELLDLGSDHYTLQEYEDCLDQLARVGRLLGGDKATFSAIDPSLNPHNILDVGCGGGHFTIELAKRFPKAQVVGMDISMQAIAYAQKKLQETALKNVTFTLSNSPTLSYPENSFDLVTATLVCHHLSHDQLIDFLNRAYKIANKQVIINDLHRNSLAYYGFAAIATPLFSNRLITHDGLISITRGFTKSELSYFLSEANIPLERCKISWHWPFRWIVAIEKQ